MEKKDFNYLSPVEINIYSNKPPSLIYAKKTKKEQDQAVAFLLEKKRKEAKWYIEQFLKNNPDAPLV